MTGHTITPIPLSIHRDGDTLRLHGSAADIALLEAIGTYKTDRTALRRIQQIWDIDPGTARLLLRAAREGGQT